MFSPKELCVSVDVGCHGHSVAIGLADGQVLEEFDITHKSEGFKQFFAQIEHHRSSSDGGVSVTMEGYNGYARPLDQMVLTSGYRLMNLNNMKLSRFKEIFPAPAKSDRIDSRKGLELMQAASVIKVARNALQSVIASPKHNEQLKQLNRRRRILVNDKTRLLNRLQTYLQAMSPGLAQITTSADNKWFLNTLVSVSELPKLARVQRKTLLKISGVGEGYATVIQQWQSEAVFSDEIDLVGPMIQHDVRRIIELKADIKAIEAQCKEIKEASSEATLIETLSGFGQVCSTTLAGEIGTLERFRSEASLAVYMGMAPLKNSSGGYEGTKKPKHVNAHAKAAMMVGVDHHRKKVPESQAYYEKKRAQGKSHNAAIRALGRHLCRVIYSMLTNNRPYISREESCGST